MVYKSKYGYIIAIGGGNNIPESIIKNIVGHSINRNILFINDASENSFTNITKNTINLFKKSYNINYKIIQLRNINDKNELIELLNIYSIVFFTGGRQTYLFNSINKLKERGINVHTILSNFLKNGGVVSGSSAGASILGNVIPTGNELDKKSDKYKIIYNPLTKCNRLGINIYETSKGLNLINVIIDQHFIKNRRLNRGFSLALDHKKITFGLDENTAVITKYNSKKFEVLGNESIIVFNPNKAVIRKYKGKYNVKNMYVNVFTNGSYFEL